jgi:hypothetical protein
MRAHGTNREHLIATPDKEHRFTANVAGQHGSIRNGRNINPLQEIWTAEFCIFLIHLTSLVISRSSQRTGGCQDHSQNPARKCPTMT